MVLVGEKGVKYGLQAPVGAKKKSSMSMFGGSDDEEKGILDRNAAVRAQQGTKRSDAKVRKMEAAALEEDANCFEYDAFHDSIQAERKQAELASFKSEQSGPKYLAAMMSARDKRKRIADITWERREAMEAKADDGMFAGKEQFATAAYKRKLEEDKRFAEELEAKDKADEDAAVDTQGMDGFLGVIRNAFTAPPAVSEDASGAADGAADKDAEAVGAEVDKQLERRAKVQMERRIADMDKYERKRFLLEQGVQQASKARGDTGAAVRGEETSGVRREAEKPGQSGDDADQAAGGAAGREGVEQPEGGVGRKRAAEERIAAARERARQRKLQKQ